MLDTVYSYTFIASNHPLQLEMVSDLDLDELATITGSFLTLTRVSNYLLPGDIVATIGAVSR